MKVIFISGKYRDTTECRLTDNIRLAEKVAIDLWKQGWAVICPHKNTAYFGGLCDDEVWLNGDIEFLKRSDAICLLSNWKESEGAKEELKIAIMMNKEIYYMGNQITEAEVENLLDKASKPLEQGQSPDSESGKTSESPISGDCTENHTR